ncbi:sialidase family protein [Tropicimonas marinistellae]|uniref:sialidase family protein n=1 Tax=Tropicimonas marinistellae TaxID=1739787 RepID=UPI000829B301|nr:sialidase family protein [Tropicimonas marinistellae]
MTLKIRKKSITAAAFIGLALTLVLSGALPAPQNAAFADGSDAPPPPAKISFLPYSLSPVIPKGNVVTGDPEIDDGFITGGNLSGTILSDGTTAYAFFRSGQQEQAGIGMWQIELSKITSPIDLTDRSKWTKTHHKHPAIAIQDVEPGIRGKITQINATYADGNILLFFRVGRSKQRDIVVPGQDMPVVVELGYPVQYPEDLKITIGGKRGETLPPEAYEVENLGTGEDAILAIDQPIPAGSDMVIRYYDNGWRYRSVSEDGGKTFSKPTLMLDQNGEKNGFGGSSVVKVGATWFMAHSTHDGGVRIRESIDGINWGPPTQVIDLGPEGSGYDHHIVGNNLSVEEFEGQVYLIVCLTGGGGLMDDGKGLRDAYDYPETAHLWRAKVEHASDRKGWEPYGQNPVMIRGSSVQQMGGAIWQLNFEPVPGGYAALFEGFGPVPDYSDYAENVALIRDFQYGTPVNKFDDEVFSQTFLATWEGTSLMAAWDNRFYDPGTFLVQAAAGGKYLSFASKAGGKVVPSLAKDTETIGLTKRAGFALLASEANPSAYLVQNAQSHRADVSTDVVTGKHSVDARHEWMIYDVGGASYLQNRYSGNFLTARDGKVVARPFTGKKNQRWRFTRVD